MHVRLVGADDDDILFSEMNYLTVSRERARRVLVGGLTDMCTVQECSFSASAPSGLVGNVHRELLERGCMMGEGAIDAYTCLPLINSQRSMVTDLIQSTQVPILVYNTLGAYDWLARDESLRKLGDVRIYLLPNEITKALKALGTK